MIPPPLIPAPSETLMPSSPPPPSSSRLDAASDLDDGGDDADVSWARPPPPALPGTAHPCDFLSLSLSQLQFVETLAYPIPTV
jgi:hypothetical protein